MLRLLCVDAQAQGGVAHGLRTGSSSARGQGLPWGACGAPALRVCPSPRRALLLIAADASLRTASASRRELQGARLALGKARVTRRASQVFPSAPPPQGIKPSGPPIHEQPSGRYPNEATRWLQAVLDAEPASPNPARFGHVVAQMQPQDLRKAIRLMTTLQTGCVGHGTSAQATPWLPRLTVHANRFGARGCPPNPNLSANLHRQRGRVRVSCQEGPAGVRACPAVSPPPPPPPFGHNGVGGTKVLTTPPK